MERWWQTRWFAALAVLAAMLPLVWPSLPPLTDLPGHLGRYHVMLALHDSPDLQRSYGFSWALIGNLGVDLLVWPLGHLLGAELATKLIVLAIPGLTAAAMLLLARQVHGRLPATALFALPLAYSYPFQLGFVNFALSLALALLALTLWLRMARGVKRSLLFVPIAALLLIAHSSGWGVFGLLAFGADLARNRRDGAGWPAAIGRAALACAPLVLPALLLVGGAGGDTGDWLQWIAKAQWLLSLLRERWQVWDLVSAAIVYGLLWLALRRPELSFDPLLGVPALLCAAAFILLPRILMGGAYVDMRMLPVAVALALLAIRVVPGHPKLERGLAIAASLFFAARIAATTLAFALYHGDHQRELAALDAIPRGATVLALVAEPCAGWSSPRAEHLPSLALVRRDAFVNDQWTIAGQQLLTIRRTDTAPFDRDPSQLVFPAACRQAGSDLDVAARSFPRRAFTHVWTIGFAPRRLAPDLALVWTDGRSSLYRTPPR